LYQGGALENSNLDPKNQQSNLSSSSSADDFLNSKNIGTNQQPTNSVNAQNANLENQAPIQNNFEKSDQNINTPNPDLNIGDKKIPGPGSFANDQSPTPQPSAQNGSVGERFIASQMEPPKNSVSDLAQETTQNSVSENLLNNAPKPTMDSFSKMPSIQPGAEISGPQINTPDAFKKLTQAPQPIPDNLKPANSEPSPHGNEPIKPPKGSESFQPEESKPKKSSIKKIVLYAGLGLLTILILGGLWWYFLANRIAIIVVDPSDAQILVDDKEAASNQRLSLTPGTHSLKISRQDYVEYSQEFVIDKLKPTTLISVAMKAIPIPEQVFDNPCLIMTKNQDGIFCLANNGKALYQVIDASGKKVAKAITPNTLAGIEKIEISPTSSLAIIQVKKDGNNLKGSPFENQPAAKTNLTTWLYDLNRYNLVDQEATYWGDNIGNFIWSPDGESVYYTKTGANYHSLVKAGKNNQNPEIVLDLKAQKIENPKLSFAPDGKNILLSPTSRNYENNKIYLFDTYNKNAIAQTSKGDSLGALFAPDSTLYAFGRYKENPADTASYSELYIKQIQGEETDTEIRAFVENCYWQNAKNLLILKSGAKNNTPEMVLLNIESKEETAVVWKQGSIPYIQDFALDSENKKMYFVGNNYYLYELEIVLNKY